MMQTEMLFETTPETTAAAAAVEIVEFKFKHKYRTVTGFGAKMWDTRVVVYRNNKHYIDVYGKDKTYGVTDWQRMHEHVEVATLKEAKALAIQWAREGIAAGFPSRR